MKKETIILVSVVGTLLLGIGLTYLIGGKNNKTSIDINLPPKVIIPTRGKDDFTSETGASYISPSDSQYIEEKLIANLRNKCPIKNENFTIDYDYNLNKFVITIKDKLVVNSNKLNQWMESTGYNQISGKYFQIK